MKGINPIEAHFEKIFAGVLALAVLGVISWQVVFRDDSLSIGGQDVSIADAYSPAEQAANRLKAQLEDPSPELPEVSQESLAQSFQDALRTPVTTREQLYAIGESFTLEGGEPVAAGGVRRIASFTPPTPSRPVVHSFRSTIDPVAAAEVESLKDLIPTEQPFDKMAVSIQAEINGEEISRALSRDPDGASGPLEPIPLPWWRGRAEFVSVQVEREEFDGRDWSNLTTIPLAPEQISLEEQAAEMRSSIDVGALAVTASEQRPAILRPLYPPTIAGESWQPPVEAAAAAAENVSDDPNQREIRTLRRRLRQIDSTLAELDRQLEALAEREAERDRLQAEREAAEQRRREGTDSNPRESGDGGRGRSGGGGREGGGGRGREGGGGRDGNRQDTDREPATLTSRVEAQMERVEDERIEVVERLVDLTGDETEADSTDVFDPAEYLVTDVLEAESLTVWTHDMTARPGAKYRYRVRYTMLNPLFGRGTAMAEDQRALADEPIVLSEASPWSEPVETTRDRYFFVNSASGETSVGSANASIDVYQFYYGFWRRGSAIVRPGDPVVATAELPEGLKAFPQPSEDSLGDDLEPQELPTSLTIDTGVWILDITPNPITLADDPLSVNNQRRFEVVLADNGELVVLSPELETSPLAVLRDSLLDSSELGLDQLPPEPGAVGRGRNLLGPNGPDNERGGRPGEGRDPRFPGEGRDPRFPQNPRDPRRSGGG